MARAEHLNPPLHVLNKQQREYDEIQRREREDAAAIAKAAVDAAFENPLNRNGKRAQKDLRGPAV